jgi:hypothetical protein
VQNDNLIKPTDPNFHPPERIYIQATLILIIV